MKNTNQRVNQEKYGDNWDRIWGDNKAEKAPDLVAEYVEMLDNICEGDPDRAHSQADKYILEFLKLAGFEEVANAYDRLVYRCSWWATA